MPTRDCSSYIYLGIQAAVTRGVDDFCENACSEEEEESRKCCAWLLFASPASPVRARTASLRAGRQQNPALKKLPVISPARALGTHRHRQCLSEARGGSFTPCDAHFTRVYFMSEAALNFHSEQAPALIPSGSRNLPDSAGRSSPPCEATPRGQGLSRGGCVKLHFASSLPSLLGAGLLSSACRLSAASRPILCEL